MLYIYFRLADISKGRVSLPADVILRLVDISEEKLSRQANKSSPGAHFRK